MTMEPRSSEERYHLALLIGYNAEGSVVLNAKGTDELARAYLLQRVPIGVHSTQHDTNDLGFLRLRRNAMGST